VTAQLTVKLKAHSASVVSSITMS